MRPAEIVKFPTKKKNNNNNNQQAVCWDKFDCIIKVSQYVTKSAECLIYFLW